MAGGIAGRIVPGRTTGGMLGALAVGVLGGLLGGLVLDLLGVGDNLNWIGSLVVAVAGAVAILYALRARNQRGRARPGGRRLTSPHRHTPGRFAPERRPTRRNDQPVPHPSSRPDGVAAGASRV